jgi:hypothetical protein
MPGSAPNAADPYIEGLLGFLGVGPDTHANRGGQLLNMLSPAILKGLGLAASGIAVGGGTALPALKAHGADLIEQLLQAKTLEKESLGIPLRGNKFNPPGYDPTVPLPDTMQQALVYAQKRWPRLFGHVTKITDVDAIHQLGSGQNTLGLTRETQPGSLTGPLQLSPSVHARNNADPANTVGHELLHVADRLAIPNMQEKYQQSNALFGGYDANSYEVRARNQGANMAKEMQLNQQLEPNTPNSRAGQTLMRKNRIAEAQADAIRRKELLP